MNVTNRTYPQPDAPQLRDRAKDRALGVFKYLLNLEPEEAKKHKLFECIVHSYEQHYRAALREHDLMPSKVELISGAPVKS